MGIRLPQAFTPSWNPAEGKHASLRQTGPA